MTNPPQRAPAPRGSRVDPAIYRALDLQAHALLADVPLHDVWQIELPGGGAGRSVDDVRALMGSDQLRSINPVVRALFRLRAQLGRLFRWDDAEVSSPRAAGSYLERLDEQQRRSSRVEPGTMEGPFMVLYVHPREAVSEARNATVHAFSVIALESLEDGYRVFWAIHVRTIGRITPLYMALIDPFRRFLVYPAVLRHIARAWQREYGRPVG